MLPINRAIKRYKKASDPNFSSVSMLLHCDGTNGASTFTDTSNNALTVTANNGVITDTAQAKFGASSGNFKNSGSNNGYLTMSSQTPFVFAGDFTVEGWIYPTSSALFWDFFSTGGTNTTTTNMVFCGKANNSSSSNMIVFLGDGTVVLSTSDNTLNTNAWNHVAWSRSAGVISMYANGIKSGTTASYATSTGSGLTARVGTSGNANVENSNDLYMDDIRITKGVGRYTSTFTVPTAAFPDS